MRSIWYDFLEIFGGFLFVFPILIAFVIPIHFIEKNSCDNFQKVTGKETIYKNFDGCYVKTDSGWQSWDEYMARVIASERKDK